MMRNIYPPPAVRSSCHFQDLTKLMMVLVIVFKPNHKQKSDADILRDAQREAMGLRPEDHERRRNFDRPQVATDEMVCLHNTELYVIPLIPHSYFRSWKDLKRG